jgi:hypothetical protein
VDIELVGVPGNESIRSSGRAKSENCGFEAPMVRKMNLMSPNRHIRRAWSTSLSCRNSQLDAEPNRMGILRQKPN